MDYFSSPKQIPFFGVARQNQLLRDKITPVIQNTLNTGVLVNGPSVKQFEEEMAARLNYKYAIGVASCSLALEATFKAHTAREGEDQLDLPKLGICIPALTYKATINAAIRAGLKPVILDVNVDGIIDGSPFANGETPSFACTVGLYGNGVGGRVAGMHHIRDAAQDWPVLRQQRPGGTATASFDPTKNLYGVGGGGMVFTDSEFVASFVRSWRVNGAKILDAPGTNAKMSELDAAVMLAKLEYFDSWQGRRRKIARYWTRELDSYEGAVRPLYHRDNWHCHAVQKYVIELTRVDRELLRQYLAERGIETRIHYELPLHEMDRYARFTNPGPLSVASCLARKVVSLPIYPELSDSEVEHIIHTVKRGIELYRTY